MSDNNGLRAALANAHNALELYHAYGWPDRGGVRAALRVQIDALAATQQPAPSAPEQPSAQAVRNVQGAAKMVANMLERDGTPVRVEAAEELLKAVGELAGLAEQPSAAVEAAKLRAEALTIFDGPETSQDVRDVIQWFYSSLLVTAPPSEPLRVGALTEAEIDHRFDLFDWEGYTDQSIAVRAFVRQVLATQPTSAAAAPQTASFVQPVPDKCDRITWRGHYYHLPLGTSAAASAGAAELLRDLVKEFERVFPTYYGAELWAHDRNIPLQNAKLFLATTTPGGKKL